MRHIQDKPEFIKTLATWLSACILIHVLIRFSFHPLLKEVSSFLVAFILLYLPTFVFKEMKDFVSYLEKTKDEIFYSLKILALVSLLIFPLFLIANHFFQEFFFHARYRIQPSMGLTDERFWLVFFNQVLLVALPEEYFFRVFLWEKFKKTLNGSNYFHFIGVPIGSLFFFNAILFAFSHSLIVLQWWHFSIFFPALVFLWLRIKTKGLLAPVLFHAFSNMANLWISIHYF